MSKNIKNCDCIDRNKIYEKEVWGFHKVLTRHYPKDAVRVAWDKSTHTTDFSFKF